MQEYFKLEISENKLEAYLTILPKEDGKPASKQEIVAFLKENGVKYGFQKATDILREKGIKKRIGEPFLIAQGDEPGQSDFFLKAYYIDDAFEAYLAANYESCKLEPRNNKEDFIINIVEGFKIAEFVPMDSTAVGKDVFGHKAPPLIDSGNIGFLGEGVELSVKKPNSIVASHTGVFHFEDNKVNVFKEYTINEEINARHNISCISDLVINGDITSSARIYAGGNLLIDGSVDSATVECKGNLEITGGIHSCTDDNFIKSNGDMIINFADNSKIMCKGKMNVKKYINGSKVMVSGGMEFDDEEGLFCGGILYSKIPVTFQNMGGKLGRETEINIGFNPFSIDRLLYYNRKLLTLTQNARDVEKNIRYIDNLSIESEKDEELAARKPEFEKELQDIKHEIEKAEEKIREKADSLNDFSPEEGLSVINVLGTSRSNVTVKYFKYSYKVKEKESKFEIIYKDNKLRMKRD